MTDKHVSALVEAIHEHTPEFTSPVAVVADTLGVSREAAYRRLRGEVAFTFEEASAVAATLKFSLDGISSKTSGNILFNLRFADFSSPLDFYESLLKRDIRFFREAGVNPKSVYAAAANNIPAEFYLRYETLADFRLYKWLHQHGLDEYRRGTFERMIVPESLHRVYGEYVSAVQMVPNTTYLFDDLGFIHVVNAIRSYKAMHLISQQSVDTMRDELMRMLDDLETIAITGEYANGHKVLFFLSDVDIDASYSYFTNDRYSAVGIEIFSLNALRTADASMFAYVKRWIQIQSRFSTLISQSGEIKRIDYFIRQREIISQL